MPDLSEDTESFSVSDITSAFAAADFGPIAEKSEPATVTTPADEEPAAEEEEAEEEQPEGEGAAATPGHNPEGPGNLKAALREAREEAKQLKAQHAATAARLDAFERQQQQAAQQRQQQQQQANIAAQLEQMDPDDIPAYLQAVQQQEQQQAQQSAAQRMRDDRITYSQQAARRAHADYDAQVAKLVDAFGAEMVTQWAHGQADGAFACYDAAKNFYTAADIEAAREAGRKEAFDDRTPARKQQSAPRLSNIPQSGPTADRDPAGRFSKQLAKGGDVEGAVRGLFAQAFAKG